MRHHLSALAIVLLFAVGTNVVGQAERGDAPAGVGAQDVAAPIAAPEQAAVKSQITDSKGATAAEGGYEARKSVQPCCEVEPADCPRVPICEERDACIVIRLPQINYRRPTFTRQGAFALISIFSAAAERGVENATIRAMNATTICPTCKTKTPAGVEHKCPPTKTR